MHHRCYIYVLSLSCVRTEVFSFQFCSVHYCGKPCAKNGLIWSTLHFNFSSYIVWSTGGNMLLLETKSFPISSKLFQRTASFLKKTYYLSLLSQPAYNNEVWIIPVKSWWKFLLQRNKQHRNIFPPICYYFLLPSTLHGMWYID